MALAEEKYRNLINSVHLNDLNKFKSELEKLAVEDGNTSEYHLKNCYYVKTQDHLMHVIAQLGRIEFLDHLIQNFSSLNILEIYNLDGKTPLHEASQFSQVEIVRLLLQHNVKVDPLKRADWTPLMLACTKTGPGALQVVQMLLGQGADVNLQNKVG